MHLYGWLTCICIFDTDSLNLVTYVHNMRVKHLQRKIYIGEINYDGQLQNNNKACKRQGSEMISL